MPSLSTIVVYLRRNLGAWVLMGILGLWGCSEVPTAVDQSPDSPRRTSHEEAHPRSLPNWAAPNAPKHIDATADSVRIEGPSFDGSQVMSNQGIVSRY